MQVSSYLKLSIAVAVATIALKTGAWWLTNSVGLLSDAMESVVNLAGATFALWMVIVAARPPDEDHPFGHHKAEYFSSGFEGVLIFIAALAIIWAAVDRLMAPQPLERLSLGLLLSVISSAMNGALAWAMLKKAREHRSMALEADARHLFTDVWTSAGVVVGLLAAADAAEQDFINRSKGGVPDVIAEVSLSGAPLAIGSLLKQAGLVPSTSEAMRMIEQGGVRIDGTLVRDKALKVAAGTLVVQVGKRKFARVTLQ